MKRKFILLAVIAILGLPAGLGAACWTYHTSCGVSGHTCFDGDVQESIEYAMELDDIFCN
jgi:hypothetical protein